MGLSDKFKRAAEVFLKVWMLHFLCRGSNYLGFLNSRVLSSTSKNKIK